MGAIYKGETLLKTFLEEYTIYMKKCSRAEKTITGMNESLHAHNLRFWNKNIYHFDLINNIDTLFIPDFGYIVEPGGWCQGNYIFIPTNCVRTTKAIKKMSVSE